MKKLRFLKVFSLTLLASASILLTSCEADTIDPKNVEANETIVKEKPSKNKDLVLKITKQRIVAGGLRVDYTIQNISDKKFVNKNSKFSAKFVAKDSEGEPHTGTVILTGIAAGKTIASFVVINRCKGKQMDETTLTGEITDQEYEQIPVIEKFNTCDFVVNFTNRYSVGGKILLYYSVVNTTSIPFVNSGTLFSANITVKDSDGNIYSKVVSWDAIEAGSAAEGIVTFDCCEGRTWDYYSAKGTVIYGEKSLDTSYSADVYKTCDLALTVNNLLYLEHSVVIDFSLQNIFNNSAINSGNFINFGNTFSVKFSIKDTNGKEYVSLWSWDGMGPGYTFNRASEIIYDKGVKIVPETFTAKVIRNK